MSATVADFIVERLGAWGIERVYGYPGDGITGLVAALQRAQERVEFVQVRHEETAGFLAGAHVKYGGGPLGVCVATSGPGAIHALNGLYDAKLDGQPVLALLGQQARTVLGGSYYQEVDLRSLYKDVAGAYCEMATHPAQVRHLVDRACRIALADRTVTALILPNDLQDLDAVTDAPAAHGRLRSSIGWSPPRIVPEPADLERAAEILNAGERVAMLVGRGALGATVEVTLVAEALDAGVAKALLGRTVVDDRLPWVTGSIGLLGTKASWQLMQECDTLLIVGSNLPYGEFLPPEGQARGVQIDVDGRRLGFRFPTEVNLVGDSALTLTALLPLLERRSDHAWRAGVERWTADWWETVERRAMLDADPINPQRVVWELGQRLPADAMLSCDTGTATGYYARDLRLGPGHLAWISGNLLTMGSGVPYAIAAKLAHPGRPAIALVGDGAMQMNGLAELVTVAQRWRAWDDPRLVVLVLNNRDLNFVTWEQRVMGGDPKFPGSQDLPDVRYAEHAKLLGLDGVRVERPEDIGPAWDAALAADRPFVLDAVVDPDVPPLPPHITREQASRMMRAMLHGDPDRGSVVRRALRQLIGG
jgi:pyruvate dehydrogenase (quinone)